MRLLIDTHVALWTMTGDPKMSRGEQRMIANSRHRFYLSVVSLWEVRIKWSEYSRLGRRKLMLSPDSARASALAFGWSLIDVNADHAVATLDHTLPHNDPFDELLLIQAQVEGMRLLTRDAQLEGHPLALYA